MRYIILTVFVLLAELTSAQTKQAAAPQLIFREGDIYAVKSVETLRITMQTSQVDSSLVDPSTRKSEYFFTERVEKVYPDGSADMATSVDSFRTIIYIGAVIDRNEYFRFNSTNLFDIENRLKDIRTIPRAQFLGHTLRYRIDKNGRIQQFYNLAEFRTAALARAFDYDVTQAMLSFSDSLRIGQLLEPAFGIVGESSQPYTVTEIHTVRKHTLKPSKDIFSFSGVHTDPPQKIEYLEGIAFPMQVTNFRGGTRGYVMFKSGYAAKGECIDSASMILKLDEETIKNSIHRLYTVERHPLQVMRGGTIKIEERESRKAEYKDPTEHVDPNAINVEYDPATGEFVRVQPKTEAPKEQK
jgi:hypothetical protein